MYFVKYDLFETDIRFKHLDRHPTHCQHGKKILYLFVAILFQKAFGLFVDIPQLAIVENVK